MKWILTIVFVVTAFLAFSQRGRQMEPIFVQGTAYRNTGWFVAPGLTYMLPYNRNQYITEYVPGGDATDTLYSGDYKRKGKIGLYVEGGRHHFVNDRVFIDHIDYGLHFKMLRGAEQFSGLTNAGSLVPALSNGKFSESFAGAFFNASNIIQVKSNLWLQNSLGVNVDYRIISRRQLEGGNYGAEMNYPGNLLAQLHYKIGFGWKPEPGIYIVPMIETPILTGFPWDNAKSTLPYFAGRYRPFIFTIRIQWLSQSSNRRCENQPGKGPGAVTREGAGKHDGNGLWGSDGKKIKKARKKQDGK